MIQILYIMENKEIDIFVLSTMIFSTCSALVSISRAITGHLKDDFIYNRSKAAQYHYRVKVVYKMRIDCDKLESYHRYTHKLMTKTICGVLSIDNSGNIEVFHIVSARNAIIMYIEVSNLDLGESQLEMMNARSTSIESATTVNSSVKDSLFSKMKQLGQSGQAQNEALKQDLNEKLNLSLENTDGKIGKDITITIERYEKGLSFDADKMIKLSK